MNELPKSIWTRSWHPEKTLIRWLRDFSGLLCSWKIIRRTSITLATLATVIGLFYAVEDWRGRRAWKAYQLEAFARGDKLDLAALIPPPVPDDVNVMKAPKMEEWLYQRSSDEFPVVGGGSAKGRPYIIPIPAIWGRYGTNQTVKLLRERSRRQHPLIDPADLPQSKQLDVLHPSLVFQGFQFWEDFFAWIARETGLTMRVEVASLDFRMIVLPREKRAEFGRWKNASYRQVLSNALALGDLVLEPDPRKPGELVVVNRTASPEGMLEAVSKYETDFDALHAALQRPKVGFDLNHAGSARDQLGFSFAASRDLALALHFKALARMAAGDSAGAWIDLQDLRRLADLTEKQPTLAAAMIRVAMYGPYLKSIAEGIQLDIWSRQQLRQLEGELATVSLLNSVELGLKGERASLVRMLDQNGAGKVMINDANVLDNLAWWGGRQQARWLPAYLHLAPDGWRYQNLVDLCRLRTQEMDALKLQDGHLSPVHLQQVSLQMSTGLKSSGPYSLLNRYVAPNFSGAVPFAARCQSEVELTVLASSLQRYWKENGNYPDDLSALVPHFLGTLPKDICTGELPKYALNADGTFLLYSVGWNLTDDGGSVNREGGFAAAHNRPEQRDWVWGK